MNKLNNKYIALFFGINLTIISSALAQNNVNNTNNSTNTVTPTSITPTIVTTTQAGGTTSTRGTIIGKVLVSTPINIITNPPIEKIDKFGTYQKPFSSDSPWNSRPIEPQFGTFQIPTDAYFPAIASGKYSTGAFLAKNTDAPMVVYGRTSKGVWNPDAESYQPTITIPHWPADTLPATGEDGHADIIDVEAGVIHSFWQLKKVNDKWTTELYAWMPLKGNGWADGAHYYQGGRAVGIPASAGIIRKHEVKDGIPHYEHALAMSLTFSALGYNPTYVYPATSADSDAATANKGKIPEGALLMLPANYDTSKIASPALKKVVETLKVYGAYVVDRNYGTPFVIYVENGADFKMSNLPWDNAVAAELQRVRGALRQVTSAKSWVNGNNKVIASPIEPKKDLNTLSMRGPWTKNSGDVVGVFNTITQSLEFPITGKTKTYMTNSNGRGLGGVTWAKRVAGTPQKFTVKSTGGAGLAMTVYSGNKVFLQTGTLYNNSSARFVWPSGGWIVLQAVSGTGTASSVRAELTNVQDTDAR